jgi:polyisoprenoid-binding protein YceI
MHALVHVFTFREGLLARLAHDLRLRVQAFEITLHRGEVSGWFEAASLRVDGVVEDERVDPDRLSAEDKAKIEQTLQAELLHVSSHPRVELHGVLRPAASPGVLAGTLRLHGVEQPVEIPLAAVGGTLRAELSIAPSRFGIKPYRALGGAIRLQDRVLIRATTALADRDNFAALAANDEQLVLRPAPNSANSREPGRDATSR